MTHPFENIYQIADFFQVRTPLLPVNAYDAPAQKEAELLVADPLVQRAIAVGSISLFDELRRTNVSSRDMKRRAHKLLRYHIRMTTRPTPYGLFAGVALGRWGDHTDLAVRAVAARVHMRPDMEWVLALIWEIESLPEIRRHLIFSANTAISLHNGRMYALNPIASKNETDLTKVPSIRATQPVSLALMLARQPIPYDELCLSLLRRVDGATEEQVAILIDKLWQYGMLLTDLRPAMTGSDNPALALYERITHIPVLSHIAAQLHSLLEAIQQWETIADAAAVVSYRELTTRMHELRHEIEAWAKQQRSTSVLNVVADPGDDTRTVLQVDAAHELAGSSINSIVADEITRAGNMLARIAPVTHPIFNSEFKRKFAERYGQNRAVPLLEVLSEHFGLGDPFVPEQRQFPWKIERDRVLLELAATALKQNQAVIELDEELLSRLEGPTDVPKSYPASFDINFFVVASSSEGVDQGDFRLVLGPNFGALQAGRNMGRFATLVGEEMLTSLQNLYRQEQQIAPDAIWAEMVYIPYRARAANVALRPTLRQYEIAFGASPGVAHDKVIPLDELVVTLHNDRFTLYWEKQKCEVRVTVGHMLNTAGAPTLVRFLEQMSNDNITSPSPFFWGAADVFPYLPRVQSGKSILSLATWKLTITTRQRELPCQTFTAFQVAMNTWRQRWQVPRYVYLKFNDNRLLLDLEVAEHLEIVYKELSELTARQSIILEEAIPGPSEGWVPGPNGKYMLEINVPFLYKGATTSTLATSLSLQPDSSAIIPEQRKGIPGSDWLFMKLYVSSAFQDDVLIDYVDDFMHDAVCEGFIDRWFFIRYADEEPHIRLRFHGEPEKLITKLMPIVCQWGTWLMQDGPCTRFTFDVYEREIERYGGIEAMLACEQIFYVDSCFALNLLKVKQQSTLDPFVVGAIGMDTVVSALVASPDERLAYYRRRATNRKAIGPLYRQHAKSLYLALFNQVTWAKEDPGGQQFVEIINEMQAAALAPANQIIQLERDGELRIQRNSLISSFVHMHGNRLVGINRQFEEQVISLLLRTYESWEARGGKR